MSEFNIVWVHPDTTNNPTITLRMPSGNYAIDKSDSTYDLIADGYSAAEILSELLSGCILSNLLAGFIALSNPLVDVAALNPSAREWDKLIATGLLGPFRQSNKKNPIDNFEFDGDGYLLTSTALSIELDNEVEGRVLDGADASGIKPVLISGLDSGGLSQAILVDSDGYVSVNDLELNSKVTACDTDDVTITTLPAITGSVDIANLEFDGDGYLMVNSLETDSILTTIDGKITDCNTGDVTVTTLPAITGSVDVDNLEFDGDGYLMVNSLETDSILTTIDGKITACNTGAVVVSSSALPSGAATDATLTDGYQVSIIKGAAKGSTDAAEITSYPVDENHQPVEVHLATLMSGEAQEENALVTMTFIHKKIHEGDCYTAAMISTELDTDSYYWSFTTPDTAVECHFTLKMSCNVLATAYLYEAPTIDSAGSAFTPLNRDRDSANTATALVKYGCTSTDDGTLLWANTFNETAELKEEFILARDTAYFIKATTLADDGYANCQLDWYEYDGS